MIAPMVTSASKTAAGSVGTVETQFLDLPEPLKLDCGRTLHPIRIAYETYGTLSPARDNVILVCHALSGDAHAAGFAKTPPPESTRDGFAAEDRDGTAGRGLGWWDGMIGPGKAFDTDRFFVVSTNLLGGCRGTTGPSSTNPATGKPYGSDFPVITVADMVRAERAFLDAIGITRLAAVAGGSLGGMQALEWAVLYPDQVDSIVVIASTPALQPQGVAWNVIARNAITADPDWQGGHYHGTGRAPNAGMGVARMVGHMTYLSAMSLGDKFGRRLQSGGRHPLHADRARVRDRKLPAPPGGYLRQAVRREHLSLHVTGADLFRPRAAARRRTPDRRAQERVGQDAADRIQFRLAVSAVGLRGARRGASRAGQGRRVPRDRGAVRARLLPAGGSPSDPADRAVPRRSGGVRSTVRP